MIQSFAATNVIVHILQQGFSSPDDTTSSTEQQNPAAIGIHRASRPSRLVHSKPTDSTKVCARVRQTQMHTPCPIISDESNANPFRTPPQDSKHVQTINHFLLHMFINLQYPDSFPKHETNVTEWLYEYPVQKCSKMFKNVLSSKIWNCPETASKDCASLASGLSASADVKTVRTKKHENFENVFEKNYVSCYIPSYPVPTLHIEINVKLPTPAPQSVAQRVVALVAGTTLVPWFQWSVRTGSDISDKSHPKSKKKSENREKTS